MDIRQKAAFVIPRRVIRENTLISTRIMGMPGLSHCICNSTYHLNHGRDNYSVAQLPTNVHNNTERVDPIYGSHHCNGCDDVDYLFAMYATQPQAFHGADEQALQNRESVFNLLYNLVGPDIIGMLNRQLAKEGIPRPTVEAFSHVLGEIGYIPNRPHRPVREVRQIMEELSFQGAETLGVHVTKDCTLFDLYGVEASEDSTTRFIQRCIAHGGIAYLINFMYLFYGGIYTRKCR